MPSRLSPLWQCPGSRQQFRIRRWRILQQIENPQTIPLGELHMIRLLDNRLGGAHGVMNNKIRQVGVLQRHRTHEQRFFLGPNPQGHPAVVFHRYSRHGSDSFVGSYTFKEYSESAAGVNLGAQTRVVWMAAV